MDNPRLNVLKSRRWHRRHLKLYISNAIHFQRWRIHQLLLPVSIRHAISHPAQCGEDRGNAPRNDRRQASPCQNPPIGAQQALQHLFITITLITHGIRQERHRQCALLGQRVDEGKRVDRHERVLPLLLPPRRHVELVDVADGGIERERDGVATRKEREGIARVDAALRQLVAVQTHTQPLARLLLLGVDRYAALQLRYLRLTPSPSAYHTPRHLHRLLHAAFLSNSVRDAMQRLLRRCRGPADAGAHGAQN